jgi:Uma2 family endonuclease
MAGAQPLVTEEQYLALEREASAKSELVNGRIFAMSGGSYRHSLIGTNLTVVLGGRLAGKPCRPLNADMRIYVETTGMYTYADAVIVCGPPQLRDGHQDTLLNPRVVFEVLSPSTEAYDRGAKFAHYRRLTSLSEYVLVAQDEPRVERFLRQQGSWGLSEFVGLDATLDLDSVEVALPLREIYRDVEFPETPNGRSVGP